MGKIIIGIDISKQNFDAAFKLGLKAWRQKKFPNNTKGFEELWQWAKLDSNNTIHFVLEATGRYGEDFAYYFHKAGHQVSIVNPAQIKYYSRSLLSRAKTDKVDSQLIATFGERHELDLWSPPSPSMQALKEQVRCLNSFKQDVTQVSNRLEASKDEVVRAYHRQYLGYLNQQIKALETEISKLIKSDSSLKYNEDILKSIPGVGEITARNVLVELPDIRTYKNAKQLAAYAGLNPSIRTSGTSVMGKSKISKVGNANLRKALFLPALSLMGRKTGMSALINRLREKGKRGKVIVGALMHKLIHIIFHIMKKQEMYRG